MENIFELVGRGMDYVMIAVFCLFALTLIGLMVFAAGVPIAVLIWGDSVPIWGPILTGPVSATIIVLGLALIGAIGEKLEKQ